MSVVNDIITKVDELKPNVFDDNIKIGWIKEVDTKIFDDIVSTHENPDEIIIPEEYDINTKLIAWSPYDKVYEYYLFAMIDVTNNELDRYAGSMTLFNESYRAFANVYNKTFRPIDKPLKLGV